MYESGDLMYYKDKSEYKGTIKLGLSSKPRKAGRKELCMTCENKNKEYALVAPDTAPAEIAKEK